MRNKATIYIFMLFLGLILPCKVMAQQCEVIPEQIETLRAPVYKTPMVWSAAYGEDGLDQLTGLVLPHKMADDEAGGVIVAGNFTRDEDDKVLHPFLARLDKRGKVVWDKRRDTTKMKTVNRLIRTQKGYAVLGDVKDSKKGNGFYIETYNKAGERLKQRIIFASGGNVIGKGFVETSDGRGFIIAAEFVARKDDEKRDALLYKIAKDGTLVWRRKYSPGLKTVFNDIQMLPDGRYMLIGEIEQEDGRMAGWLMSVDNGGSIGWQRQYPRGSGSSFSSFQKMKDQSMIVVGTVKPSGGTKKSGWVMRLNTTGTPLWQRYYTGSEYRYDGKDVIAEKDGRFSVLLDAYPIRRFKKRGAKPAVRPRGHVRLLTLSPRGYLLGVENYTDGQHAHGAQLVRGAADERLVIGSMQGTLPDGMDPNNVATSVFDGWVFAATALDPYFDPCMSGY